MFGVSASRELPSAGTNSIAEKNSPHQEFTILQPCVWQVVRLEWWSVLVVELLIRAHWLILGDLDVIAMAVGIGSKLLTKQRLPQHHVTNILPYFLAHLWSWWEAELIQSVKMYRWKFMTLNPVNGTSLMLFKDSAILAGKSMDPFSFMVVSSMTIQMYQ